MFSNCKERIKPNVLGILPQKLLFCKFKNTKFGHFSQQSGITPDNRLYPKPTYLILFTLLEQTKLCNDPTKLLFDSSNNIEDEPFVREGKFPQKLLKRKSTNWRLEQLVMVVGMFPVKELL
ncbi:hypothetical protein HanPSC8_Chr07g0304541 [Helianthus annuus]|nr:hypothetical protein HanPSC8_Chr07g0304541 [Helianthus annuus]